MAPATHFRASLRPVPYHPCKSFESVPSDISYPSSTGCHSRDASVSSRLSANSTASSAPEVPPWDTKESFLPQEPGIASHYDYDLPCEFEFLGCNQRFHPQYYESWISHTASHFIGIGPPPCTVCTFCDGEGSRFGDSDDPILNWRRRMIHMGGHLAQGSCDGFRPDYWIIEYMWSNDLISEVDYTWTMKHAIKPTFKNLTHTREYLARMREDEVHDDLDKERRQMRKEKQKGKGSSEKYHLSRRARRNQKAVLITDKYGPVAQSPALTSVKDSDQQNQGSAFHEITEEEEVPRLYEQDRLFTIDPETTALWDDGTLDSSSFPDDTDSDEEIDSFVPQPYMSVGAEQETFPLTPPSMISIQSRRVDQLMEDFLVKLSVDWQSTLRQRGPSTTSNMASNPDSRTLLGGSVNTKGTKRPRENREDQKSDDEGGEGFKRSGGSSAAKGFEGITLLFACPYRKQNPRKYCVRDWGTCALTGHQTISRVKSHLYRHHLIHQCERCKELFDSEEEVHVHFKGTPGVQGCPSKESQPIDGITGRMRTQLQGRKKAFRGQTPAESWEGIYRLLFPGADVPDPYFEPVQDRQEEGTRSQEYDDLTRFQEYINRELPRFFQEVLENAVATNNLPLEENIRNELTSLLREAQNRALLTFRATLDQLPLAQLRNGTPPDLSSLQITQQRVPQSAQSMHSSDSGYSSNPPNKMLLSRVTGNVNISDDARERIIPLDTNGNQPLGQRTTFDLGSLARVDHPQRSDAGLQAPEPQLSFSGDDNMVSGSDDFLMDSWDPPPESWAMNPDFMSLDLDVEWNSGT